MEFDLVGGIKVQEASQKDRRLSLLLWGPAGCGKTTLAATAPGKKLWINFDPDGTDSIAYRNDVLIADLSSQKYTITERFKTDDGLGIGKLLADDSIGIDTVVVDSLTAYSQLAVESGIATTKGATLERPSPGAYGARNALTLRLITGLLRLTAQYKKNIIFITHEDSATTDDSGNVLYITMQLGGKLPDQASLQISEVWFMNDDGKQRKLAVRPCRARKPMKSRMFDTSGSPEFIWKYDINSNDESQTLASWYQSWVKNDYNKISLPT
ncbi:MAG: AAA family ATPase [Microcystis sp. M60BS1]|uniref:AAA family ATPase n=1 Tax=unclassified Microcystis TaxID=2643300 RepID=UPI00257A48D1|nr:MULTISPECIES: AAA family ATPase [unclassified Microcystis]MCA2594364.1 AAA family ATPase [Microcystis sp. M38BS1]MCA6581512.1 AAA family ATPase [Pseudanabaena sp. M34BS1SP1A06MG]MCA2510513.1 AAA family ATPase [Microcystis sp. M60BS1]MCA2555747.1 AAA family ATPase [Microcystis sp. M43BS1]MCA2603424.1 AAA family ATPase [Microcystis sp. M26BS1]